MLVGSAGIKLCHKRPSENYVAEKKTHYGIRGATFGDEAVMIMESFRFACVMQNLHTPGGIQEKIVHAWLARAVPVYYGPPEAVEQYNPESFINCEFNEKDERLEQIQEYRKKMLTKHIERNKNGYLADDKLRGGYYLARFQGLEAADQLFEMTEEFAELILKVRELFKDDFDRCVAKVREVDQDEEKWRRMVHAPVVKNNRLEGTVFDMELYARRFRKVLRNAGSYLVGDEDEAEGD